MFSRGARGFYIIRARARRACAVELSDDEMAGSGKSLSLLYVNFNNYLIFRMSYFRYGVGRRAKKKWSIIDFPLSVLILF